MREDVLALVPSALGPLGSDRAGYRSCFFRYRQIHLVCPNKIIKLTSFFFGDIGPPAATSFSLTYQLSSRRKRSGDPQRAVLSLALIASTFFFKRR